MYEEAIAFLEKQRPLKEYKWSEPLAKACREHAQDIGNYGLLSTVASDGTLLDDRANQHGVPLGF